MAFSETCHNVQPDAMSNAAAPSRFQPTANPTSIKPRAMKFNCTPSGWDAIAGNPSAKMKNPKNANSREPNTRAVQRAGRTHFDASEVVTPADAESAVPADLPGVCA